MLIRLFYVSAAAPSINEVALKSILCSALIHNRRRDLTGFIAKSDGHFAQVLEGREEDVDAVLAELHADARHQDLVVLSREQSKSPAIPS